MTGPRQPRFTLPGTLNVLGLVLLTTAAAAFGALVAPLLGIALAALTAGLGALVLAWLAEPDDVR